MGMTYLLVCYRFAVGTPVHVPPIAKLTQNQSKLCITFINVQTMFKMMY